MRAHTKLRTFALIVTKKHRIKIPPKIMSLYLPKKKKIKYKIVIPFIIIFTVIIALLSSGILRYLSLKIEDYLKEEVVHAMATTKEHFDLKAKLLHFEAKNMDNSLLAELIRHPDEKIIHLFHKKQLTNIEIDIHIYNPAGLEISEVFKHETTEDRIPMLKRVKGVLQGKENSGYYSVDTGLEFEIFQPIFKANRVIGALSVEYLWDDETLRTLAKWNNSNIMIVKENRILATSFNVPKDKRKITIPSQIQESLLKEGGEYISTFVFQGKSYSTAFTNFLSPDSSIAGMLIVAVDKTSLQNILEEVAMISFLYIGIGIGIIVIISFLIAKGITKPIQTLNRAYARVAKGDFTAKVLLHGGDELSQLAASFNAMTLELKEAQETLVSNKKYIENILESMRDSLFVVNEKGMIQDVNQAVCSLLGYSKAELVQQSITIILPPNINLELYEVLNRCFEEPDSLHDLHLTFFSKSRNEIPVSISGTPLMNQVSKPHSIILVARDMRGSQIIAELKNTHQHLKEAKQEIETADHALFHANKLVSLGTLVAGVAHEINNPNSFIMLNASLLKDIWDELLPFLDEIAKNKDDFTIGRLPYTMLRERVPNLTYAISDGSARIKKIVANIKDFARQDASGMNQQVNICEVVWTSVALTTNRITKTTENFEVTCDESLPMSMGNRHRLEQVVVNLILNACDALRDHRKKIAITAKQNSADNTVRIMIEDEGQGMTEKILATVKTPFFTTKRETGGTGLGLAISEKIIQEHGGSLVFESFPGQGTTATIILPIINEEIK